MTFVLATNNPDKAREFTIMAKGRHEFLSLAAFGLALTPKETGRTFEENARIKATETADFLAANGQTGYTVIADDSGLVVDAMDGAPGVDSALFLGADASYAARHEEILRRLSEKPGVPRTARFTGVIACVKPSGEIITAHGTCEGEIARRPAGTGGFGYDPILLIPELGKTTAELPAEQKNDLSHRGRAFRELLKKLGEPNEKGQL